MELQEYQIGEAVVPYRDIVTADGLIRVEYFHNDDPDWPQAYQIYLARMGMFAAEQKANPWATVVLDTLTSTELSSRKYNEKIMKPMEKFAQGTDTRQWFALATDDLEEMVIMRYAGFTMNTLVLSHIDERKNELNGEIIRGPFAPGRLSRRSTLGASYQEQYRTYSVQIDGRRAHQLQTQSHSGFAATTQIDVPDPCYPSYESMWAGREEQQQPVHLLLYGDTGSGKSTFAATFPKPMLVWCFDPHGKDMPYKRLGVQ